MKLCAGNLSRHKPPDSSEHDYSIFPFVKEIIPPRNLPSLHSYGMAILPVVEFSKQVLIQNQKGFWLKVNCSQMKLPNFDNWSNDELSKIEHHFRK